MNSKTQDMKYRQSLLTYAQKYGVSRASRKYNKSRSYIYFWCARYDGSLQSLACRSRRPHSHPNQHTPEELKLISDMYRRNPKLGIVELWARMRKRGYNRILSLIHSHGAKALLALNPATPISYIEESIEDIDGVLLMTVNPGFAGQQLVKSALKRLERLQKIFNETKRTELLLEVDGNCSLENIPKLKTAGANLFVLGTSSLFDRKNGLEKGYAKALAALTSNGEIL